MTTTRFARLEGIAELAARMRVVQRKYFRTRDHRAMVDSKRLEAELDAMLAALVIERQTDIPNLSPERG